MKSKRSKINSILNQTDWRLIKDSMLRCGITWKDVSGNEYVPSIIEIEAKAKQMLEDAANSSTMYYKAVAGNMMVRKSNVGLEFGVFISYKFA